MQGHTGTGNTDIMQKKEVVLFHEGNAFFKFFMTEEPEKESGIWTDKRIKTDKEQRG